MSDPYEAMRAGYVRDELTAEEVVQAAAAVRPLVDAVRDLLDAVVRSEVSPGEFEAARGDIERATARLRAQQLAGPFGVRLGDDHSRAWGNPVVGARNAMAVPLKVTKNGAGSVWAEATLGARFEGPPGSVHGGISALLLDQMVGEAAMSAGTPGMTGTLTLRYRRPAPLGRLRLEANVEREEGAKTIVRATLLAPSSDGWSACVEAEAVMIMPRWVREMATTASSTSVPSTSTRLGEHS